MLMAFRNSLIESQPNGIYRKQAFNVTGRWLLSAKRLIYPFEDHFINNLMMLYAVRSQLGSDEAHIKLY